MATPTIRPSSWSATQKSPIAAQNPEVEPEFEEYLRKALARRTEDRFQSATYLQDALAHYLFSRGLKTIQRDIAEMVRTCIVEQAAQMAGAKAKRSGTIDTVLHAELDAFTSLDFDSSQEGGGRCSRPRMAASRWGASSIRAPGRTKRTGRCDTPAHRTPAAALYVRREASGIPSRK